MYDNARRTGYSFLDHDFGTGSDITQVIAVPLAGPDTTTSGSGLAGRVVGITIYNVTENFVGSTSDSGIQVGDGSDPDLYFETGLVLDEDVDTTESVYLLDDGDGVAIPLGETSITVTFIAGDGGETGIANVLIDIDWFGVPL